MEVWLSANGGLEPARGAVWQEVFRVCCGDWWASARIGHGGRYKSNRTKWRTKSCGAGVSLGNVKDFKFNVVKSCCENKRMVNHIVAASQWICRVARRRERG